MPSELPKYMPIIRRGLRRRCPQCGEGRIFKGYLSIYEECPTCRESFKGIRTDDAAPWATILVVGHLTAPVVPIAVKYDVATMPLTLIMVGWVLILSLAILPLMKGVFVGLNWRFNIRDGKPGSEYPEPTD
jgi:uncharacterized protein (DUF983 family)